MLTDDERQLLTQLCRARTWEQACRINAQLNEVGSRVEVSMTPDGRGGVQVGLPDAVLDELGIVPAPVEPAPEEPERRWQTPPGAFRG